MIKASRQRRFTGEVNKVKTQTALVVFGNVTNVWILRILKRGFRHCFVVLQRNRKWIICSPFFDYLYIDIIEECTEEELSSWYESQGFTVIKTQTIQPSYKLAPVRVLTCVEVVKRVLGVRARWINTPFQLYRYLVSERKKKIENERSKVDKNPITRHKSLCEHPRCV